MNKADDRDNIISEFSDYLSFFSKGKDITLEDFKKIKTAENILQYLQQGEKYWRDNKFEEAHSKFRQGYEYLREILPSLDNKKNRKQYSYVKLYSRDLLSLSEIILFDRGFNKIFQVESLKELKSRLFFLCDYLKRNMSSEVTHYHLRILLVIKLRCLLLLIQIVIFESPPEVDYKHDLEDEGITTTGLGFHNTCRELIILEAFIDRMKGCISKYCGLSFIPVQEEMILMKILHKGMPDDKKAQQQEEEHEPDRDAKYVVFLSQPSGVGVLVDKDTKTKDQIQKKYLNKKEGYDIFIYEQTAYRKTKNQGKANMAIISLDRNILRLLVLFLIYKNSRITYEKLYGKAWSVKYRDADAAKKMDAVVMNNLKTAVTELRNEFECIKGFCIPHARDGGYICEGDFKFCLVLKNSTSRQYTLPGA